MRTCVSGSVAPVNNTAWNAEINCLEAIPSPTPTPSPNPNPTPSSPSNSKIISILSIFSIILGLLIGF